MTALAAVVVAGALADPTLASKGGGGGGGGGGTKVVLPAPPIPMPYSARPVSYVGVKGTLFANVDNFTVRAGTVTDPPPAAVAPPGS